MNVKNLQNMVAECITYADEVNQSEIYPTDAHMPLRDLFRYDVMIFLGFLYEQDNGNIEDQMEYIKINLRMILSEAKFLELVGQKCQDHRFLSEPPKSLSYFIESDRASMNEAGSRSIAKSKFIVDCFRKLGEGFIAYEGASDEVKRILTDYVAVMNATLNSAGIVTSPHTSVLRSAEAAGAGAGSERSEQTAQFADKTDPDLQTISTFDAKSGQFVTKKAINISGYNIQKKRADDVSEFLNFQPEEEPEDAVFKRGEGRVGRRRHDESDEVEKSLDELVKELQALTGLATVKDDVMHLINIIKVRKLRERAGLRRIDMSFHLVFTGNPGTGKTTIARILAKIYKQLGLVSRGQFIEVDRSGLVDHYSGGTALKTTEVIDRAIGGILFIDEAYTLTHNKDSGDYGQEAVDILLKRMEDDRDDFVVIVAGYTDEMREFIESNPGLRSRFNKYIHFPDYSSSELMEIFKFMCEETDYVLTPNAAYMAETYLRGIAEGNTKNFANARLVRNYFERCIDRQATRIVQDENLTEEDLITFVREDMIEGNVVNALGKEEAEKGA